MLRVYLVPLVTVVACGFQPRATSDGATAALSDAAPPGNDSAQTIDAAVAVDAERVDAIGNFPQLCSDLGFGSGSGSGSGVLYLDGDPEQPFFATCAGGHAFLAVTAASNFGQYTAGGKAQGSNVRTSYAQLEFDPETKLVDISDQTFAKSTGMLGHPNGQSPPTPVTSMPVGVAMDCKGDGSEDGLGEVDLTGLPFIVVTTWVDGGSNRNGRITFSADKRTVTLTGGGNCGWTAPNHAAYNPFNKNGGAVLGLQYSAL